jgi:hypothetical protein
MPQATLDGASIYVLFIEACHPKPTERQAWMQHVGPHKVIALDAGEAICEVGLRPDDLSSEAWSLLFDLLLGTRRRRISGDNEPLGGEG